MLILLFYFLCLFSQLIQPIVSLLRQATFLGLFSKLKWIKVLRNNIVYFSFSKNVRKLILSKNITLCSLLSRQVCIKTEDQTCAHLDKVSSYRDILMYFSHLFFFLMVYTNTWGAVLSMVTVATMVKVVYVTKHNRSSTIAANFQSLSTAPLSSSSLILSVITLISFRMRHNSLWRGWFGIVAASSDFTLLGELKNKNHKKEII